MKKPTILILGFPPMGEVVASVRAILDSGAAEFIVSEKVLNGLNSETYSRDSERAVDRLQPDLVLICTGQTGPERTHDLLKAIRLASNRSAILVFADGGTPEDVRGFLDSGAQDFLTPPLRPIDLLPRLWRLGLTVARMNVVAQELKEKLGLKAFIGDSPVFLEAIRRIPAVAQCDASVLITGETGTGKELCARAIHYLSPRSDKPFVPVNCGAIPTELVENELFGHDQGAFTGANSSTLGLLGMAEGGTLFLDEIDSLPLQSQVKLLRFLQERKFQPLGSRKTISANIRIIAASNARPEEAVQANRFRQDLYYRLNVVPIELPALRQRMEDVPMLAYHFLQKYANEFGKAPKTLAAGAMQKLMSHDWPGNIRELENLIARAVILSEYPVISKDDFTIRSQSTKIGDGSFQSLKARIVADFENRYIRQLLQANAGNITKAAREAKKHRRAFWQLMQKHNIHSTLELALAPVSARTNTFAAPDKKVLPALPEETRKPGY
jgi:DNA-binding NtrC family response regulator